MSFRKSTSLATLLLLGACARRPTPVAAPTNAPASATSAPAPAAAPVLQALARIVRSVTVDGPAKSPIFAVALDGDRVFFNDGEGRLWSASKDASRPASVLVESTRDSVRSFVVLGDTIYFTTRGAVRSVPKKGGPITTVVDNRADPILIVGDGESLYHTVFDGSATFRIPLATKKSERFFRGGKHETLAVDERDLYIASYFGGTLTAVSKKTHAARTLAAGLGRPVRVVLDDRYAYVTSERDGTVRRIPKQGGAPELIARGQSHHEHMAVDGEHVYWATRTPTGEHNVMRARRAGTPPARKPESVYSAALSPGGIALDDRFIFLADKSGGEVLRILKPR